MLTVPCKRSVNTALNDTSLNSEDGCHILHVEHLTTPPTYLAGMEM